jgi:fumarate hydratase class II
MAEMRQEKDSLGVVEVPAGAMYGAQTQRAVENHPISGMRASGFLMRAIGMGKRAAAEANCELAERREQLGDAEFVGVLRLRDSRWRRESLRSG